MSDWRIDQISIFRDFWSRFWAKSGMLTVEKYCFLETFLSAPRPFFHLESSKQGGNSTNRTSETSSFQNFFPIQKILILKKIRNIFVSIGAIFTWLSVNRTYIDLCSKERFNVAPNYGQPCKNRPDRYKNTSNFLQNQYFLDRKKVLET